MHDLWAFQWPSRFETSQWIGDALKREYRRAARDDGVRAVAARIRRLRGGADPMLALRILGIRPTLGMPVDERGGPVRASERVPTAQRPSSHR